MKLIPGLPKLRRKQDLAECAVPGCTRHLFTHVLTWPVCWQHWLDNYDAENLEVLARQTHTARMLESASEAAPAAGATDGARPPLASFPLRKASGVAQCRSALSFLPAQVGRVGALLVRIVKPGAPFVIHPRARRSHFLNHGISHPARLLPFYSGSGTPALRTRPVFALILPDHRRKT